MNCDILKIVRGNDFATQMTITALDAGGNVIEDFSLEESTDVVVKYTLAGNLHTIEAYDYDIEGNDITIQWSDLALGKYGFEIEGKFNGYSWRSAARFIFQIVADNASANIPDGVLVNGIYILNDWLRLLSGNGGGGKQVQADWTETDTNSPAYIQNKPDLNNYATDTELQQGLATKQDTLVSGENIKTINNQPIVGEGNIEIGGAVESVNGQTGEVVLDAEDVGAASAEDLQDVADDVAIHTEDIANLQAAYAGLTQSNIVPLTALPSSGVANTIYRVAGTDSYSDYMWDGSQFVLMATYNNAIANAVEPVNGNVVSSGGVYKAFDALKGTKLNYVEGKYWHANGSSYALATAMLEEEYIPVSNGDEIYWDYGAYNTTINLLIYNSSKTKIDNRTATSKSFTISDENAAYIRASFNLAYKDKACIKVNGNVVWYATDNVDGYIPQQIENNNDTIVEKLGLATKVNIGDVVDGNECNYYDGYKITTTAITQNADYIVSKPIPLEVGATYTWWHGLQGYNTMGVIRIITSSSFRYISAADTRSNRFTTFTAQSGDVYACVTFAKNYADNRLEKGTDVIYRPTAANAGAVEEIVHIVSDTDIREELVEVPEWTADSAIDINTGAIITASTSLVSQFIPVKAGEMYRMTGYNGNTQNVYRLFAGYSAADESTFVPSAFPFVNSTAAEQSIVTIIPDGVNYVRILSSTTITGNKENITTGLAQGVYHIVANKYDGNLKQIGFSHLLYRGNTTPTTVNNRKYFTLTKTDDHGAYCSTALIPVKDGDKFTITRGAYGEWYFLRFFDEDFGVVGTQPSDVAYKDVVIDTPNGAKWLYIITQYANDKCYIGSNEPISNNVENRYVKGYLDNVEYDNTDYSYSMVRKYCFLRGFNRVDQPNGFKVTWTPDADAASQVVEIGNKYGKYEVELTNDVSSFDVFNVVPNEPNLCKVSAVMSDESRVVLLSQKIQPEGTLRMIKANSLFNIRDIGGWSTEDGHKLKYNAIFRGCRPDDITEADRSMMVGLLGLNVDIDLSETSGTQTVSAFGENVEVVDWDDIIVKWYYFSSASEIASSKTKLVAQLSSLLSILQEGKVIYLHCYGGADRTGVSMMNLEAILGVTEDEMMKDYELTSFSTYGIRERSDATNDHPMQYVIPLVKACEGANLSEKWINWLSDSGLTTEMVTALREIMLV